MAKFDPKALVSSAELAEVLGVTERRVQQLEAESVFANVGKGRSKRFVLADAVQAWKEKSEADARRDAMSASTAREMFEAERARKFKIDNDLKANILVTVDDAMAAVDRIAGEIRTALAGIAPRLSNDPVERRRIDDQIDAILNDLADRLDQAGSALQEGRDPLAAGPPRQP